MSAGDARGSIPPSSHLRVAAVIGAHAFGGAQLLVGALLMLLTASPTTFAVPLPARSGWPLGGPISVIRGFDPPKTPWGGGHRGADLAARIGDPVLAAAAGTVTFAGQVAGRGVVVVDHGRLRTTYEPLRALVSIGVSVRLGAVLGVVAPGSHCGSRPCLHWGLVEGKTYLDPLRLVSGSAAVRLLPGAQRQVAVRRAAARTAAVQQAAQVARRRQLQGPGTIGQGGGHGFVLPVSGRVTSGFGPRFHPVLHTWKLHDGTDLGARCGTPIRAPFPGRVTRRYYSAGYGNRLLLDHGHVDGRHVVTGFNHAISYSVRVGSRVRRGQVIGLVGTTGYSTGCHLHLMVWLDGKLTDPASWF